MSVWCCTILLAALSANDAAAADDWQIPAEHPRLFVHRDQLPRLRVLCGVEGYRSDPVASEPGVSFGSHGTILARLKTAAAQVNFERVRPDDLWAFAFLHVLTGQLGQPDEYTRQVAHALLAAEGRGLDLDAIVALDYCWDALTAEQRSAIVARMAEQLEAFEAGQSPLNYYRFSRKLHSLALAIVLYDQAGSAQGAELDARVRRILSFARIYLEGPFVRFCQQRGAMPVSGGNALWEDTALVLAVELWRTGTQLSLWPQLRESLGRSMYSYFYGDSGYALLNHGFLHDDGSDSPLQPGKLYQGFIPAVPFAIASQTQDPIAAWYANRGLPAGPEASAAEIDRYLWVHLVYGPFPLPETGRRGCPLAWNFGGGWVTMRSDFGRGATVILFDVGQPYWRPRQHYDAGQFQIYRKGRLAIDSGDDVTHEAVPAKGGSVTLGRETGDWDRYFQATIAHNCVTLADRSETMATAGRAWPAMGNQRLIPQQDYDLSTGDVHATDRHTGRLIAFQNDPHFSYAAADLTAAYSPEVVTRWERRLLFIHNGALLVLDRVQTPTLRSLKTWHLHLPARPRLAPEVSWAQTRPTPAAEPSENWVDLDMVDQLTGLGSDAAIWELSKEHHWLEVTHGHGRLFWTTLLPQEPLGVRRLAGGPMEPRQILAGPSAGRTYYGGDLIGYEHRLWPASILKGPNVVYKLGRPTGLGPNFGSGATWGRYDVYPALDIDDVTFLHLLIPTDKVQTRPPPTAFEHDGERAIVDIELIDQRAHVELNLTGDLPGKLVLVTRRDGRPLFDGPLATQVEPNGSIPLAGGSAGASSHP